jgi:hypothetical protein
MVKELHKMVHEVRINLFTGTMLSQRNFRQSKYLSPPKANGGRVLLWQWSERLHGRKKVLSMNELFYKP